MTPDPELAKVKPQREGNVTVRFSSVSAFRPGTEADFWVVQAFSDLTGRWYYHPGPPDAIGFIDVDHAVGLAKKVALAGEIDPGRWRTSYPRCSFEAHEMKTKEAP